MKMLSIMFVLIMCNECFSKCLCPDDRNRAGRRCGGTSSFCKPGGKEPACGTKSNEEKRKLKLNAC